MTHKGARGWMNLVDKPPRKPREVNLCVMVAEKESSTNVKRKKTRKKSKVESRLVIISRDVESLLYASRWQLVSPKE